MIETRVKKPGNWNNSNIFFELQKIKGLPFESVSMGSDSLTASNKDGSMKLEICSFESGEQESEFTLRISCPNKKIEKNIYREMSKGLKHAKFTEIPLDSLAKLKQDIRKALAANGFRVTDEVQEEFAWKLLTETLCVQINLEVQIDEN